MATIRDLFATPVGVFEWPNAGRLNAELRDAIMARFNSSPGLVSSNRKGWHSKYDMHKWPEPCIAEFLAMVRAGASQLFGHVLGEMDETFSENWLIRSCWSNVNPPGGFNRPHHHIAGSALLSGVYYVDIGDCPDPNYAGRTILQDRSGVARPIRPDGDALWRECAIVPKPGALVLFPAALFHYVEPYRGNTRRISVAFDLGHPKLEALYYPDMRAPSWWWRNFRGLMLVKAKIPEKTRALVRFGSYLVEELRRPGTNASLLQRLRVTRERAEADEAEATEVAYGARAANGGLPEKRPFI